MLNKGRLNQLEKDFFKTSNKIFRMGLSCEAIALFCYLSSCNEEFNPSVKYAANKLRLHRNTVSKAFQELEHNNIIRRVSEPQRGVSTKYEFINPDKWGPVF